MFVGGNYMIGLGQKLTDESSQPAILVASTPLWMALLELVTPRGDRLTWRGWLGIGLGLVGVGLMIRPDGDISDMLSHPGHLLILGSSLCWAVGSFVLRHRPRGQATRLAAGAYQLMLGGLGMCLLGLCMGEANGISTERFTWQAMTAYVYLLIFGSLVGYMAYLWLLDHVSAALAGSYAYVNPLVAVLVGWGLGAEQISGRMLLGMGIILGSVFLVRGGVVQGTRRHGEPGRS
jgi:drug/metabolite transporter (DMT)-like permease